MTPLPANKDAYGQELLGFLRFKRGHECVERDDGLLSVSESGGPRYFASFSKWPRDEQIAISFVHGRVLDIGCGAGRHALFHTTKILRLPEDLPIVVEIVDALDKIEAFLPTIDAAISEGLATVERVKVRSFGAAVARALRAATES